MAIIKLQLNEPLEGVLKYARGKHYDSQFGREGRTMYSLESGDVIFIDEGICDDPDALFHNANVGVGVRFRLTLRKRGGKYYEVRRLDAAAPAPEKSKLERDLEASIWQAQQQRATVATSEKVDPSPATSAAQEANSRKETPSQQSSHPIAIVPPAKPRAGSLMASALVASIDAVLIAQEYATAKGLAVTFGPEQVQRIAATLYIQHSQNNRQYQRTGGQ